MIKKIIILALILWLVFLFYKKYMADTFEPFFRKHVGNVDLFGLKCPSAEKAPK